MPLVVGTTQLLTMAEKYDPVPVSLPGTGPARRRQHVGDKASLPRICYWSPVTVPFLQQPNGGPPHKAAARRQMDFRVGKAKPIWAR